MRFGSVCSGIEADTPKNTGKPYQESEAKLPKGMSVKAPTRNIEGYRFGRLVALKVVGKSKQNSLIWQCVCDCGNLVNRTSAGLRKSKGISSCGCYLRETSKERLASMTPWNKGKSYSIKKDGEKFANKKAWAEAVIRKKGNVCEQCGWDKARCDVHHILPISEGGEHTINNGVVLCPNCHRILHQSILENKK